MGVGAGLYMYDVLVKSSRSLSHLLISSCIQTVAPKRFALYYRSRTVAWLFVLSCPWRWCIVAKHLDGSRCHLARM